MSESSLSLNSWGWVTKFFCILASVFGIFGTLVVDAKPTVGPKHYTYGYDYAVSCAGQLRNAKPSTSGTVSHRALWQYTLAAGELARRKGVRPGAVDIAIAKAARQSRNLHAKIAARNLKSCLATFVSSTH